MVLHMTKIIANQSVQIPVVLNDRGSLEAHEAGPKWARRNINLYFSKMAASVGHSFTRVRFYL